MILVANKIIIVVSIKEVARNKILLGVSIMEIGGK